MMTESLLKVGSKAIGNYFYVCCFAALPSASVLYSLHMKFIQLNVERDKHCARWVPFLAREQADVVCLEEVLGPTVERLRRELGLHATYVPTARLYGFEPEAEGKPWGVAVLTKEPHRVAGVHRYGTHGDAEVLPALVYGSWNANGEVPTHRVFLVVEVGEMRVGVTHFTWSPNGLPNAVQRRDLPELLRYARAYPDLVLCGDCNVPRGMSELYDTFTEVLTDHVPLSVVSTLDPALHRVPGLMRMVDYLWSTPHYRVSDVRVVGGLSDHRALVGEVER